MKIQHYFTIAMFLPVFGMLANTLTFPVASGFNGDWYFYKTEMVLSGCFTNYAIEGDYRSLNIKLREGYITFSDDKDHVFIEHLPLGTYPLVSASSSVLKLANGDSLILERDAQHLRIFHKDLIFYLKKLDTKELLDSYLLYKSSFIGDQCENYVVNAKGEQKRGPCTLSDHYYNVETRISDDTLYLKSYVFYHTDPSSTLKFTYFSSDSTYHLVNNPTGKLTMRGDSCVLSISRDTLTGVSILRKYYYLSERAIIWQSPQGAELQFVGNTYRFKENGLVRKAYRVDGKVYVKSLRDSCTVMVFSESWPDKYEETDQEKYSVVTGIGDRIMGNNLILASNPVKDGRLMLTNRSKFDYEIYTVAGLKLLSGMSQDSEVEVGNLDLGLYVLKVTDAGSVYTTRFWVEQ